MKKIDLNLLSKELNVVSLKVTEEKIGGFSYSVTLPSVIITPDPPSLEWSWGDWNWSGDWWENGGGDNDPSYDGSIGGGVGGGTGGNNGGNDPNPNPGNGGTEDPNVKDPNKLLDNTKSFIDSSIESLKKLIQSGAAPSGAEEYLKTLENAQNTLDKMNNSGQKYRIDEIPDNGDKNLDAYVSYDSKTGEIVLGIENIPDSSSIDLIIHELTHIEQLMNGDLWIENGQIKGYDINDEVEAYQNQHDAKYGAFSGKYDLDGNDYPDGNYKVTPEDILNKYPGFYDDLPEHNWSKPSGSSGIPSESASSAPSPSSHQ